MTKLEEIARDVNDGMPRLGKWDTLSPPVMAECIDVVRRVVLAMREPSEATIEVAARAEAAYDGRTFDVLGAADKRRYRERFAATFISAIDAILSEAKQETAG